MGILKKLCYLFIVLSWFTSFSITPSMSCFLTIPWFVDIRNGIPNSTISVHVKSGDDDLGVHDIAYDNSYNFHFCDNVIHSTLYWADISYGSKFVHFNVVDAKVKKIITWTIFMKSHAYWLMKEDGYYLTNKSRGYDDPAWKLMGKW
ncbi:putative plant self-incompatibility S1 [Helianthus annuus]|uniref:S-protein homolog n=1 Tax=Helianthus annuus TaxID=4232 RepID=A0A9K3HHI7_HELAN|nr:putative plant self-incompatibility S1 [Helianthus annuus]KAJ0489868.1 putative plant self-incompatibility S1 [Helianthus annuus]KAJ0493879.1 putative plant self-incompatibility S1 [Helianthus annuus]KAJ0505779.1 putative plant self-incompatibility S1 [Helianthus annuus]KAJ0675449.1 putative plant self-incompatibility S1 [Helianthus annuus]